jgi:PQQ-dependent dehydrogenase (methanol/ethanol family)
MADFSRMFFSVCRHAVSIGGSLAARRFGEIVEPFVYCATFSTMALGAMPAIDHVAQGKVTYASLCASCHGSRLEGGNGPALVGKRFNDHFGISVPDSAKLAGAVRRMPVQAPGSLTAAQYDDIVSYILAANAALPRTATSSEKTEDNYSPSQLPALPTTVAIATSKSPTDDELLHSPQKDWLMFNGDYKGTRFSPLTQINSSNAAQLQPVCILQLGVLGSLQSSPLIYAGVGYATTAYRIRAFDASTCRTVWTYDYVPEDPETNPVNRGATLYEGKLFWGTTDGHLLAIDMKTGKVLWNAHVADSQKGSFVGAAPVAFQKRVIVGLAGGDFGANGHIFAFDANNGARLWTFSSIPTGTEAEALSWSSGTETGGGGTWTTVSVDTVSGLVYVPIGNPGPDLAAEGRPGKNLYTNSIVALNAADGKIAWYVQQIAGDVHDWDTAAAPALYEQSGHRLMAVGSKNGYVYLYDRDTHKLVSKAQVSNQANVDAPFDITPVHVCPGYLGGVEWNGPAYDPGAKMLFVNSVDWCATYKRDKLVGFKRGSPYIEGTPEMDPIAEGHGTLKALDALTGHEVWSYSASMPMIAGVTPTAGGTVFTGGSNGQFLVFDSISGRILYEFYTGGAVGGGVATYMVANRQYVAVTSGNRSSMPFGIQGSPTVIIFALPDSALR